MTDLEIPLPTRRATRQLGQCLAQLLEPHDLVILSGSLGAGKTFLVRALARAMGLPVEERVTSPTFALVQELETSPPLVHADLYRLTAPEQAADLGLDAARDAGAVLVVEWGTPFAETLGGDALLLDITLDPRRVLVDATGVTSTARKAALTRLLPLAQPRRLRSAQCAKERTRSG
jgi:tRNA threonylcarbamoyladenosine biosynthesis protein TsaE